MSYSKIMGVNMEFRSLAAIIALTLLRRLSTTFWVVFVKIVSIHPKEHLRGKVQMLDKM